MKSIIEAASPSELISVEDAHWTMLMSRHKIGCQVEMETESGKKYQWLPDGHLVPYKERELHDSTRLQAIVDCTEQDGRQGRLP